MIRKIIKMVFSGIAMGCTISCLISMIGVHFIGYEWFAASERSYSAQIIASMICGIAWVVPSMVYDNEKLSRIQQMLIHFSIGMVVYLPLAFYMKWIPTAGVGNIVFGLAMMVVTALLIWFGFYLYYRGEAQAINRELAKKANRE